MIDYIEAVAHDVRYWAEVRARDGHAYGRKNLCGWCARASAELHGRLLRAGVENQIHLHAGCPSHAFVRVGRYIVDVTATQFDQFHDRPVVILSAQQAREYPFYNTDHRFSTVQELIDFQKQAGWPACETARPRISPCRISREVPLE